MTDNDNKSYEAVSVTPVIKDLENLFAKLGRLFIGIIMWFFNLIKSTVQVSIKNYKLLLGIMAIAGIMGYSTTLFIPRTYQSSMVVKPILYNIDQLYTDVAYFQALVDNQSYDSLASILKLSSDEVKTLKGFEISPHGSDLDKIRALSRISSEVDSASWAYIDVEEVMGTEQPYLFSNHKITVKSTNPNIFKSLENVLLVYFERAEHLQESNANHKQFLAKRKAFLEQRLLDLKVMQDTYYKVMLLQAEKKEASSVTNVSMNGDQTEDGDDLMSIFQRYNDYQGELERVNKDLQIIKGYYRVVSKLNPVGEKIFFGGKGRAVMAMFLAYVISLLVITSRRVLGM